MKWFGKELYKFDIAMGYIGIHNSLTILYAYILPYK